jgi:hypothetical protein
MRNKQKITTLAAILLCSLLLVLTAAKGLANTVLANGIPTIDWSVIGSGGGHAQAGIYTLDATIGQAVVGTATDTGLELCSGFWCGTPGRYKVYLPLVLRND